MFCQEVGLGEGFPYADAGYPCYRSARGENDTKHEMVKDASRLEEAEDDGSVQKNSRGRSTTTRVNHSNAKLDGWLVCMSFNNMGKFKVNGQSLDKTQIQEGIIESITSERQRALMCTKGGLFAWDNYLTHAFENACRAVGVTEAIVTGEVVTYNDKGQVAGRKQLLAY